MTRKAKFVYMMSFTDDLTIGKIYEGEIDTDCFEVYSNDKGNKSVLFDGEFELIPMEIQERVFGDWKIRLRYEEMPIPNDYHRWYIELLDLRSWALITVDSNVCDKTYFIEFDDAISKTKGYLKHRFNYELVFE